MRRSLPQPIAFRLASLLTAINVVVAAGFAVLGVIAPGNVLPAGEAPNNASFLFALYAAARAVPLAAFTLVAIYRRTLSSLLLLGALAGIVQFLDAGVGLVQGDLGKAIGPLIIAVLQMFALWRVSFVKQRPRPS